MERKMKKGKNCIKENFNNEMFCHEKSFVNNETM